MWCEVTHAGGPASPLTSGREREGRTEARESLLLVLLVVVWAAPDRGLKRAG